MLFKKEQKKNNFIEFLCICVARRALFHAANVIPIVISIYNSKYTDLSLFFHYDGKKKE